MQLTNATKMQAGYTMGIDPSAREHVVVVVKGTFRLPERRRRDRRARGGAGAARHGRHVHGRARLLRPRLRGRLPAPQAALRRAAERHRLRARGPPGAACARRRQDRRLVQGDRRRGRPRLAAGAAPPSGPRHPSPSRTMPITYDRAFGGVDDTDPDARRRLPRQPGRPRLRPRRAPASGCSAGPCPTPRPRTIRSAALGRLPPDGLRPRRPRLAAPHRLRRHLRPELARQRLPVPPGRLRRPLLPGGPGGPADRRARGRRGGDARSTSRPTAAPASACPPSTCRSSSSPATAAKRGDPRRPRHRPDRARTAAASSWPGGRAGRSAATSSSCRRPWSAA